jgi:hypothetical protein
MRVLDATVTRRARGSGRIVGPQQRVDVITALKAMTIWPAYQIFEEKTKGSLEVGKLADFAILSKDPTKVEPATIADIKVTETVKEGVTVFRLAAAGGKTAGDALGDGLGRMLHAMAHPAAVAVAKGSHGFAWSRPQVPAKLSPGSDPQCAADVMLRLGDAMARGG